MTSDFERTNQIERHPSIELSDQEHLSKLVPHEPIRMEQEGWVYREIPSEESMSPALKEKFNLAKKICADIEVIDLSPAQSPSIPMKLEMPILEETIRKSKQNAESKSKSPRRRLKKINSKSDKAAVESLQAKL